jgi:hypothetical protein
VNPQDQAERDPFDCQDFYDLCQNYRWSSETSQSHVSANYKALQDYCRAALASPSSSTAEEALTLPIEIHGKVYEVPIPVHLHIVNLEDRPMPPGALHDAIMNLACMADRTDATYVLGFKHGHKAARHAAAELAALSTPPAAAEAQGVPMTGQDYADIYENSADWDDFATKLATPPQPANLASAPAGYETMRGGKPVVFWRDDALEAAAGIVEAYGADAQIAVDIRAMKSDRSAPVSGSTAHEGKQR